MKLNEIDRKGKKLVFLANYFDFHKWVNTTISFIAIRWVPQLVFGPDEDELSNACLARQYGLVTFNEGDDEDSLAFTLNGYRMESLLIDELREVVPVLQERSESLGAQSMMFIILDLDFYDSTGLRLSHDIVVSILNIVTYFNNLEDPSNSLAGPEELGIRMGCLSPIKEVDFMKSMNKLSLCFSFK